MTTETINIDCSNCNQSGSGSVAGGPSLGVGQEVAAGPGDLDNCPCCDDYGSGSSGSGDCPDQSGCACAQADGEGSMDINSNPPDEFDDCIGGLNSISLEAGPCGCDWTGNNPNPLEEMTQCTSGTLWFGLLNFDCVTLEAVFVYGDSNDLEAASQITVQMVEGSTSMGLVEFEGVIDGDDLSSECPACAGGTYDVTISVPAPE